MRQAGLSLDEEQRIRVLTDCSIDFRKVVELAIRKVFGDAVDEVSARAGKGRASY